ncbi:N-acetylmuramoyl-L-alanine amidase [Thioclava sp.]|uniref:N-acetylmuramoyl-L-alanine amidase n=1 Tax=Thioclava sp. TaxID=1933450 RepID=UPI003AA84E85
MSLALPSPNFGERRGGARPELVVIHYTAMPGFGSARTRLCLPEAEVSAHWLIGSNGLAEQLVAEEMRAWHAGAGQWRGCDDVNSRSIGIELDNLGERPFPEPQMAALEDLLGGIMTRWAIPPENIIGHSDMSPGRKIDPGSRFDWQRLARQGLSIWPESRGAPAPDGDTFCALAQSFGYADMGLDLLLATFRLRFRPRHDGPLDRTDMALMADLAMRFGDDGGAWRSS